MSDAIEEAWGWVKTAPLPVVLAITLVLGGWVWRLASAQDVDRANVAAVVKQVDAMDGKLDKLLEGVAELKAEQRSRDLRLTLPTSAAPPSSHKEK